MTNNTDNILIANLLLMSGVANTSIPVTKEAVEDKLKDNDFKGILISTFLKKNKSLDDINDILSVDSNVVAITKMVDENKKFAIKIY